MSVEKDRILSIIEFTQQSARLRSRPTASVAEHRIFACHENDIRGLPGISVNVSDAESEDEIWLSVKRLNEIGPPKIGNPLLRPWVSVSENPTEHPRLLDTVQGSRLIEAGTHYSNISPPQEGKRPVDLGAAISLSEYDDAHSVKAQFDQYISVKWGPWSEEERIRRRTIQLYSQLFTLKHQLDGNIVESPIELVWGSGIGIWRVGGVTVSYPLVGRPVEITLNQVTAEIEIRPRDVDARIEIDWYASVDNPGLAQFEQASREFFESATTTYSPFDHSSFEPLLLSAVTHLGVNGIYWPNEVTSNDRSLPKADDKLKVTDTWVLFARPRTNSLFLQDLEKLRAKVEQTAEYPPAVAAIVTDPESNNPVLELPSFRGVSASYHSEESWNAPTPGELYFPKPFNDEQVRIIQLLEVSDGVVVQGPPGTGKTHTIANIICHYLAEGRRVLVTSLHDPALVEVRRQLPAEIRPLAISLLTSEQDGMKQFEYAINKIAAEIQSLDRFATEKAISQLEGNIDGLHRKLAHVDRSISSWAERNLSPINLQSEEIEPRDAATEVVEGAELYEWIPDLLGIEPKFDPQFSDEDIVRVRDARRFLGPDIDYLHRDLPQPVEFPDSNELLRTHQDLSQYERLRKTIEKGEVPALADSSQETLALAQELLNRIQDLHDLRNEVDREELDWIAPLRDRLHKNPSSKVVELFEALGIELESAILHRNMFLERPVITPAGIEFDNEILAAISNLAEGRKPFGIKGIFGKTDQKAQLDSIRVLGGRPTDPESWKHVSDHLASLKHLTQLCIRWNALAPELQIDRIPDSDPSSGLVAAKWFAIFEKIKLIVKSEAAITSMAIKVFPGWNHHGEVAHDIQMLRNLEKALRHHLTKNQLANVWAAKERLQKALDGNTGRIVDDMRDFITGTLGNPSVEDEQMQNRWFAIMAELSRILKLGTHLNTLIEVCDKIEQSGAPNYAAALKLPLAGTADRLLPDNWRAAWRLRRLATHFDSIDEDDNLKKLSHDRQEIEKDLSRTYQEAIEKRTWLKLAQNASPKIRSALQAYLNAIQKIGKGTGKRAIRYRHDARTAAMEANPAVPCWIMPHYRVSESLPADLGCFDLVIIDEASQSDLTALPSLLRAKKVLIVGDDKQVSPEGIGLEEEKVKSLMARFLRDQVQTYKSQMSPDRSIYDLFKVVFANSSVMLKEHFRCAAPIIEYSKREFYNHEIRPLRMPKASERLDPPLIDVLVEHGYRRGDFNDPEAQFIVNEIRLIVSDPTMAGRSIGVVSLLGSGQAKAIYETLKNVIGLDAMSQFEITCGDARTFQGKERNIMFLSMVAAPNERSGALSKNSDAQRFNVAASRAKDRMYLVRSVRPVDLSEKDKMRRSLIAHFQTPFYQDEARVDDLRTLCESPFEREVYDELTQRGYLVIPQVRVGGYRIDMVVEGHNDTRLAIECDGDKYHGPDKWADDTNRQRILERAGWYFWRCFASTFVRHRTRTVDDLLETLASRGVEPIGAEGAPRNLHTEHRIITSDQSNGDIDLIDITEVRPGIFVSEPTLPTETPILEDPVSETSSDLVVKTSPSVRQVTLPLSVTNAHVAELKFHDYIEYSGPVGDDPREARHDDVADGLVRIISTEGPVVVKRAFHIYLNSCGIKRMGHELEKTMHNAIALTMLQKRVVIEYEAGSREILRAIARTADSPLIKLRRRGSRTIDEIPPSELQVVGKYLERKEGYPVGSEGHMRRLLECLDLVRLTSHTNSTVTQAMGRDLPYVDLYLRDMGI